MKHVTIVLFMIFSMACAANRHSVQVARTAEPLHSEIRYRFDNDEILFKYHMVLNNVVAYLNANPDRLIVVEGHTDIFGEDNYNMDLGDRRALNAKSWLVKQGIAENRIIAVTYGEENPVYPETPKNRRVMFRDATMPTPTKEK